MQLVTRHWGVLSVDDDRIITLTDAILGFPDQRRFVLLPAGGGSPFLYLQSADVPTLAFAVLDPLVLVPDYEVPPEEGARWGPPEEWAVLVLCTITPTERSANLRSPVVINRRTREGGQIVLSLPYPFHHPLSPPPAESDGEAHSEKRGLGHAGADTQTRGSFGDR